MSDERMTQLSPFSYLEFLKELASRGEITQKVVEKILGEIEEGKIKVQLREGILISKVVLYQDKNIGIFLPPDYNSDNALFEAPRILIDTLKVMANTSSELSNLDQVENSLRSELSKKLPPNNS